MLIAAVVFCAGMVLLIWSADRFIVGACAIARQLGMAPLVIGMLVVGMGTSAPELLVSVIAATGGNPGLAIGNALGSNITNIGLVLGLTALLAPIAVASGVVRKELPLVLLVSLASGAMLLDAALSRPEGLVLLLGLALLMLWMLRAARDYKRDAMAREYFTELKIIKTSLPAAIGWAVGGLLLLILSSRVVVWSAVTIADSAGISDLVIGLTIVAIGTSLPELATSIMAIRRDEHDIALGNVLGSNLFNLLAVLGVTATVKPVHNGSEVFYRDWSTMMLLTVLLFVMSYGFRGRGRINRFEGGLLLAVFGGYYLLLIP